VTIISDDIQEILRDNLAWDRFSGSTVLISGAAGFLPSYLVRTLLALNDDRRLSAPLRVLALVRNIERARVRLGQFEGRDDFQFVEQDVTQPVQISGPINFIIHAASPATPLIYLVDPINTVDANVLGTRSLLALARDKRSKGFLYFSSSEIYGEVAPNQIPTKEDQYGYLDPTIIRSVYSESKRLGETMCVAWAQQYGVETKIVRPFHTYGPGMSENDGRVFSDFVFNIINHQNLSIKSDGLARRAFCYIADASIGFFRVLLDGKAATAYNIGNPAAELSIGELANILIAEFSERKLSVRYEKRPDDSTYSASKVSRNSPDISRASALGWSPKTPVAVGFRRTVTAIEEGIVTT